MSGFREEGLRVVRAPKFTGKVLKNRLATLSKKIRFCYWIKLNIINNCIYSQLAVC